MSAIKDMSKECTAHAGCDARLENLEEDQNKMWPLIGKKADVKTLYWAIPLLAGVFLSILSFQWSIYASMAEVKTDVAVIKYQLDKDKKVKP